MKHPTTRKMVEERGEEAAFEIDTIEIEDDVFVEDIKAQAVINSKPKERAQRTRKLDLRPKSQSRHSVKISIAAESEKPIVKRPIPKQDPEFSEKALSRH